MQSFICEIPVNDPEKMQEFQTAMNEYHSSLNDYIQELAKTLNISDGLALDVWYLRTRSRWTQSLENAFIQASKDGHHIIPNGEEIEILTELGYKF